jgi:hypothetical protein
VQTSFSSTAARVRAAAQPPRPARPPRLALPPRPAPGAGAAQPAWVAPTPRSRWYSCSAPGETPPPPREPGTTTPGGSLDRCIQLTSPIRTPPHGSTSYPHEGTAPTPPRRHKLTSLSPTRHGDPSSTSPLLHCLHTRITLGLPAPCFRRGRPRRSTCCRALGHDHSRPLGAEKDPVLPAFNNPMAGAQTQAGSWGYATPEGGVRTWRASPGTWDQYRDPTPSTLISLPSEGGKGSEGQDPCCPWRCGGGPQPFP